MGVGGPSWEVIQFPDGKSEREELIAKLFANAFDGYVAMESEPSFAPFGEPTQNPENDIDFKVLTADGEKLMELAEFAPLEAHGPKFDDAPKSLHPRDKAALALKLVKSKSDHQGGENRFLVIYTTEQGFWLDPFTIERLRRLLTATPPKFDRVYYLKPHTLDQASVSEIYPGKPHHIIGDHTDEQLDQMGVDLPHPTELKIGRTAEWKQEIGINGKPVTARFKMNISGFESLKRRS
jgi:hypothetical protein